MEETNQKKPRIIDESQQQTQAPLDFVDGNALTTTPSLLTQSERFSKRKNVFEKNVTCYITEHILKLAPAKLSK